MYELSGSYFDAVDEAFGSDDPKQLKAAVSAAAVDGRWVGHYWGLMLVKEGSDKSRELLFYAAKATARNCFRWTLTEVFDEDNWSTLDLQRQKTLSAWFAFSISEFFYESVKLPPADHALNEGLITDYMNIYLWKDKCSTDSAQELKKYLANGAQEISAKINAVALMEMEKYVLEAQKLQAGSVRPRRSL